MTGLVVVVNVVKVTGLVFVVYVVNVTGWWLWSMGQK